MPPLLLLALTLISLLWLTAFLFRAHSNLKRTQQRYHYLNLIQPLRQLFEHLPQHRGSANALLQGDTSFKTKLDQLRQQIDNDLHTLTPLFDAINDDTLQAKWTDIGDRWKALRSTVTELSAAESFQHHTRLITKTTHLIGDVANQHLESSEGCETLHSTLSDILFNQLLFTIEFIARARGVGTAAASQQRLSTAHRVQLGFLHTKIEESTSLALKRLTPLLARHPQLATKRILLEESQQAAQRFANLLKSELLDAPKIAIAPNHYFDSGSAAIGKNLTLFDEILPTITDEVQRGEQRAHAQLKHTWLGTLLFIASLSGLWHYL